jgi:hypothetical protein
MACRPRPFLLGLVAVLVAAASAAAQTAPAPPGGGISSNLPPSGWVSATEPIRLKIPGVTLAAGARLAVFIGSTDWTSLFAATADGLEYRPRTLMLPSGEHELVVYVVTPANAWTEQARFPIRVRARGGFEKADAIPAADFGTRAQVFEAHDPSDNISGRPTYRDVNVATGIKATLARDGVTFDFDAGVVGVSYQPEALRFGTLADSAPRIDLSSYSVKVSGGRASALVGHLSFGKSRHLIPGFASRGFSAAASLGSRADVSFMVANGTSIVGWSNPFGLNNGAHRVIAGSVGVELVAARPGGLRLEATLLDGSLETATDYTQQAITDTETSRGVSGRVVAADRRNRARIDAGYTRSRFTNPFDPLLSQGTPIVPVQELAQNARYLDTAFDLVQNAGKGLLQTSVTALFRHERVDPLFRSVGGSTQADRQENAFEVQTRIGETTVQAVHMRMHDNLEEISSLLTSNTDRSALALAVPAAAIFGKTSAEVGWAPRMGYTFDRVHQAGEGIPVNSDFSATHVPDQISVNQTVTVEVERAMFRAGYRFGRSHQDNRQVGQERADLINVTNAMTAGLSLSNLNLTGDVSFDHASNLELSTVDRTRRIALMGEWRITPRLGVSSTASMTWLGDDRRTSASRMTDFTVEGYWQIVLRRSPATKPALRAFVRYARQSSLLQNVTFGVPSSLRTGWTINSGINVSVF